MVRSIYAKIFLWFWVALAGVTASVVLITVVGGSQPLGRRWMAVTTDLCARGAVDLYTQGGKPALDQYLSNIERAFGIHAALLDPRGQDILGRGVPPGTEEVLAFVRRTGKTRFHASMTWNGAALVPTPQGDFVFVAQVNPWKMFWERGSVRGLSLKLLIALLSTGLLCAILAGHIARPIRALQAAAGRLADGDLSVRVIPAIPPRNDELADLARDFDRMAERIQMLLQKQQELLGDISHELRSPLTRLNVSLELLRYGETDAIERMQTDLNRLDVLIGQVLTLTRLQVREGQKIVTIVNLRSIVESVAEDARFEGKKEGKSVVIGQADDCWVNGDPSLLRSCIENVVRNALRYTKPQTGVIMVLNKVNGSGAAAAHVLIADHGSGVPPESLPRLFEPFYRVSEGGDSGSSGFGLGLAIAQRIVLLHGGKIAARNRDGGGLEMEIQLPARDSASDLDVARPRPDSQSSPRAEE